MKKKLKRLLMQLIVAVLFVTVTALALFFAYGYRLDVDNQTLKKTSIIDIVRKPVGADVFLDGKLVADELPEQLKDILPGVHELEVSKEGFHTWQREVEVREDFVTIVRDVLLVPLNPLENLREVLTVAGIAEFYRGNDFWLVKDVAGAYHSIRFTNGKIGFKDIEFAVANMSVYELYDGGRFLMKSYGNEFRLVDFDSSEFKEFVLPDAAEQVHLDMNSRNVYFVMADALYSVALDSLNEVLVDEGIYHQIADSLEDYTFDGFGNYYLVSGGELVKNDEPMDLFSKRLEDIFTVRSRSGAMLVGTGVDGEKSLLAIGREGGGLSLLSEDLIGVPHISESGLAIYATLNNQLWLYDFGTGEKSLLRSLDEPFEIVGWYDEYGHYVLHKGGGIHIGSIYRDDLIELVPNIAYSDVLIGNGVILLKQNSVFKSLDLDVAE